MQAQRSFTNLCFKVSVILQMWCARLAGSAVILIPVIAGIALVLCLMGYAHAVPTLFSHVTGHTHTALSATAPSGNTGPWPPSPPSSSLVGDTGPWPPINPTN